MPPLISRYNTQQGGTVVSTRNVGKMSLWAILRQSPPCGTEVTSPTLPQYLHTASEVMISTVTNPPFYQ